MNLLKYKNLIYSFLIAIFAVTACSKSSAPKPDPKTDPINTAPDTALSAVWPTDADVYFVGIGHGNNGHTVATYWKNGVPNILSSNRSSANAIAIKGTDVYITGTSNINGLLVAILWKNGVATELASRAVESEADGIVISGNDIYIAGAIDAKATYWKNGVATTIPRENISATTIGNSIAIDGSSNIYMAGYTINAASRTPGAIYWKNGIPASLEPNSYPNSNASSVAVNGDDVYIAGTLVGQATVWKNGVASALPNNSSKASIASAVLINGSDVYEAGFASSGVVYWKNGVMTELPFRAAPETVVAIGAYGPDIYIAGGVTITGNPIYWKNGIAYQFSKDLDCTIYGVTVAPH
jgi:hypothetical protein